MRPTRIGVPRPTGAAWGLGLLILALLAAAINTGNNLLYLLFGLLSASLPISLGGSLLNLIRIGVSIRLPPGPRQGASFGVEVTLRSLRKRRPARSLRISVVTAEGVLGPALVERLEPGESRTVLLTAQAGRRGPLRVLGARLRSTYPLGLMQRRRFFPSRDEQILILPPAVPQNPAAIRAEARPGLSRRARVMGNEYEGLRRGREEDDVRRVDWKATARSGELMVRETMGEGRPRVEMELRTRCSGGAAAARRSFEKDVARIAGQGEAVLAAGGSVSLAVDDGEGETFIGAGGARSFLRRLALLEPTDAAGRGLPPLPVPRRRVPPPPVAPRQTPPGASHAASTLLALSIGTLALFLYDGLSLVAFALLSIALVAVSLRGERLVARSPVATRLWQLAGVAALLYFFADLVALRHNPLSASLNLIAFITLYKLFNARTVRDDRQMLLVSLLQIVLAAALTTDVTFVLPLAGWLLAATHAQVAWTGLPLARTGFCRPVVWAQQGSGRFRYARPTAALAGMLLAAGGLIFVTVPHLGTGTFAPGALRTGSVSGFTESARLGAIGRIKLNRAKVMEIGVSTPIPSGADLRWRGVSLAHFDGRTWTAAGYGSEWRSADHMGRLFPREGWEGSSAGATLDYTVRMEAGQSVLFAASMPEMISSDDFLFLAEDDGGALKLPRRTGRRTQYTVRSRLPRMESELPGAGAGTNPPLVQRLHLGLPRLDPRVHDLARRLTEGVPDRLAATLAIRDWLSGTLPYSLEVNDAAHDDPLAAFLFQEMPGHCEYFATSMVVLARSAGIPARFVAGYLRGERNRFSRTYTVRQSDAHAWVEVYFPGVGWVPFDPTPPAGRGTWEEKGIADLAADLYGSMARLWDDYVIGIDLGDQLRGFLALRDGVSALRGGIPARLRGAFDVLFTRWSVPAGIFVLVVFSLLVRWLRPRLSLPSLPRRGSRKVPAFYRRLLRLLGRRGLVRAPGETPAEFAERAATTLPGEAAAGVREITGLYYRVRFDSAAESAAAGAQAAALLARLRRLPAA